MAIAFHHRALDEAELCGEPRRSAARRRKLRAQRGRDHGGRTPVDVDKGTGVRRLLAGRPLTRALYAGDDTTDLDAFRGLDEAGLDVALKVSVGSPEMNDRLLTEADLVVAAPVSFSH